MALEHSHAVLTVSRVSYLLSTGEPEDIISNDVVVTDIFESILLAGAGLRSDRLLERYDCRIVFTLTASFGRGGEVSVYIKKSNRRNSERKQSHFHHPFRDNGNPRVPIPKARESANLRESIARKTITKRFFGVEIGAEYATLVHCLNR
jgi:hypothetical protein